MMFLFTKAVRKVNTPKISASADTIYAIIFNFIAYSLNPIWPDFLLQFYSSLLFYFFPVLQAEKIIRQQKNTIAVQFNKTIFF